MRLSSFINSNLDLILADWVAFAGQQEPAAIGLDQRALLDHGKLILLEIAADMQRPQDDVERQAKSEGNSATASLASNVPSRSHARERAHQGFAVEQMVAEYRALRANVLRLWSASSGTPTAADVEDVVRFNEAIDQATAESLSVFLGEVDRTRDLFLGILGHDLRGPLNTILSCALVDQKTRGADSPTAAIVLRSVAQMKALLDDLIEYTRNRLGAGLSVERAPLNLGEFVQETLNELGALSVGRLLELTLLGDSFGQWDARRLHQALSNLIFNALKYGEPGSVIRVSVDGRGKQDVILAVENTGKPISARFLPTIFDPLVRAEVDEPGGSAPATGANLGLGLYVVREVAKAHGGSVDVTSRDTATRFELRLPRVGAGQ